MILNIVMGCLINGIFCHANLPGYPETLNTTLKDKARLTRTSRDIEGHFKGASSAIDHSKTNILGEKIFKIKRIRFLRNHRNHQF